MERISVSALVAAVLMLLSCSTGHATPVCSGNCSVSPPNVDVGSQGNGDGQLTLRAGDVVGVKGAGAIGAFGTSSGVLDMSGAGTRLSTGGGSESQFWVGNGGGRGLVRIAEGALLTVDARNNAPNFGDARLNVGRGGQGTVEVRSGGQILVQDQGGWGADDDIMIGRSDGAFASNGRIDLSGGLMTLRGNAAYINVGAANLTFAGPAHGNGELLIRDGSHVLVDGTSGDGGLHIGRGDNSSGRVLVEGSGSLLELTGRFAEAYIANGFSATTHVGDGTAFLHVRDQGVVRLHHNPAAAPAGGPSSSTMYIGLGLGTATVLVERGGRIEVDGSIRISSPLGRDNLQSATLIVNGTGVVQAVETIVGNGDASRISAILAGTGSLNGALEVLAGGLVAPGNSPGILTVNGDVNFNGGTLKIEIAGLDALLHDLLLVNGNLNFGAGSSIEFSFIDGFLPKQGDALNFLQANGIAGLDLAALSFSGLKEGFEFVLSQSGGVLQFLALNDAQAVPEPNGAASALIGLFACGWISRRARRIGKNDGLPSHLRSPS